MPAQTPVKSRPAGKRPAERSSQDPSMHPSKKPRLDGPGLGGGKGGAGAAVVGKAGVGARKAAAGKGRGKGLIPTAPAGANGNALTGLAVVVAEGDAMVERNPAGDGPDVLADKAEKGHPDAGAPGNKSAPSPVVPQTKTTTKSSSKQLNPAAAGTTKDGKRLIPVRRMPPRKPTTADTQSALGRPKAASGSNPTREVHGRNVVFVTRKTSLGSYMRRCKALLVDEGLNQITLHALCVAIPHAVMLLYALTDILPYPRQFIHHDIHTESVECMDEMVAVEPAGGKGKGKALAIFEEDEAGLRSRTKSAIRITIRIGKGARVAVEEHENPTSAGTSNAHKARPNKAQRAAKRAHMDDEPKTTMAEGDEQGQKRIRPVEEEESMNEVAVPAAAPAAVAAAVPRKTEGKTEGKKQGAKKGKNKAVRGAAMDVD